MLDFFPVELYSSIMPKFQQNQYLGKTPIELDHHGEDSGLVKTDLAMRKK